MSTNTWDRVKAPFTALKNWVVRWQESAGWLPGLVVLAMLGWLVIGALDELAIVDSMALLVVLPIKTAYAVAALGLTFLGWRRWRTRLTEEQQQDLWRRLMRGQLGAIVVYLGNLTFYLVLACALLRFFSLAS